MNKIKLLFSIMLLLTLNVKADIQVNWLASYGFYAAGTGPSPSDPIDYIRHASQPGAGGVLTLLLWSPDNTFGAVSNVPPVIGTNVTDDPNDILLNTFTGANAPYADYSVGVSVYVNASYGEILETGYITAVINQDLVFDNGDDSNQGTVVSAAPYFFSGIEPPVTYDHNSGDPFPGDELSSGSVVPVELSHFEVE